MKLIPDAMAQTESPAPQKAAPAAPAGAGGTVASTGAQSAPNPNEPQSLTDFLAPTVPFLVILGIVYIVVLRPQQRKQKDAEAQLRNVRRGDVVVVNGFIGKVTKVVDDNEFEFEAGPNMRLRALRSGITEVRSRGEPVKDAPPPAKS